MHQEVTTNYFLGSQYEQRIPEPAIQQSVFRDFVFQIFSLVFLGVGISYLYWRWTCSINPDALWFALPLVFAETFSFIGSVLMIFNCWAYKDPKPHLPVHYASEINGLESKEGKAPISIDVFIATYNEDFVLVKRTVQDAKRMTYPFDDVKINIYLLDDGRRDGRDASKENFKKLVEDEGVNYISRENNLGYKAGNLNNAFRQTNGHLIVILDADTRPYPKFLEHTTGYFRNEKLAWVQTPQWFYDLTEPVQIKNYLKMYFGKAGWYIGSLFGRIKTGKDIFGNDPKLFYDVILRKRNNYNAAFCCGAGSIQRREALQQHADKMFANEVKEKVKHLVAQLTHASENELEALKKETEGNTEKKPFMLHASEDIYTSILLHAEGWQSVMHPHVECKMLSPQDLDGWVKQRTRYATGSIDICFGKHSPVFLSGLSIGQRISYFTTIYSYFSPLWLVVFLVSPAIFFFTLTPPIMAFNFDFFKHFIPFMVLNFLVTMIANWGIGSKRSEQYYVASFWLFLQSIIKMVIKLEVKFNVTSKKIRNANNVRHIFPHVSIIAITLAGLAFNTWLIIDNTHPSYSAYAANCIWTIYNIYQLSAYIRAGLWRNADLNSANT